MTQYADEKRVEPRILVDDYYSVEFSPKALDHAYQFKIWNLSSRGMCILVRQDSKALEYLAIGDILEMKYYSPDPSGSPRILRTEIKHITRDDHGRFKNHYLVGLSILEGQIPLQ
ncbi:MAG: PilZ domain-containing protein [Deltaproteobacteria bacterium]|nr:PilZ domain-containing protein [Deltaproteobacteria bacterium]